MVAGGPHEQLLKLDSSDHDIDNSRNAGQIHKFEDIPMPKSFSNYSLKSKDGGQLLIDEDAVI